MSTTAEHLPDDRLYERAFRKIALPAMLLDASGTIRAVNESLDGLFPPDMPSRRLTGQSIETLARERSAPLFTDLKIAAGGGTVFFAPREGCTVASRLGCRVVALAPAPLWLLVTLVEESPLRDRFAELNVRLNEANERAAQEHRRRRALEVDREALESFSYTAAHDLKAPLLRMSMLLDVLREDHGAALGGGGTELVDALSSSTRGLRELVSGLLDHAISASSALTLDAIGLDELVERARERLGESLRGVGGTLEVVRPLGRIDGDPLLVGQLLDNLLSNAVKYRHASRPLHIRVSATLLGGRTETLRIEDNGAGFAEAPDESLFEPFKRLHTGDVEGSGIGLSTCRNICRRHGWEISARGRADAGALFSIRFPQDG